jgi:MFS family permease
MSHSSARRLRFQDTFAAFSYRNYRLWFAGQVVSLVGTWMQNTAQGYLIYDLTGSSAYVGLAGFAAGLPAWMFTLYGGVIADRVSKRAMLVVTQTAMMVLAFILAGLVFTGTVQAWQIIALAFLLGIANAFDAPARQAFVVDLVDRQDLSNAIAFNSTIFNLGAVVGPAVAGLTYAALGPAWCFTLNGISFIAVIIALLLMQVRPVEALARRPSAMVQIKEGLGYVKAHRTIRVLILNMGMVSLFGISMMTLLPAWSVQVLGGDVRTNGLLISARGFGSLLGALMLASLGRMNIKGKLWTIGNLAMPLMLLGFAFTRWLPLSMIMLVGVGWSFMIQANASNALVQMQVPDELRGRVMSIYTLTFFGGMPIGALLVGSMAERLGEPQTVMLGATVLALTAGVIFLLAPVIRKLE